VDFSQIPTEEGKSQDRIRMERDFHDRWTVLQKKKKDAVQAREEVSHLKTDKGEKIFDSNAPLLIADAIIEEYFTSHGIRTLQFCSDTFVEWNRVKYEEINEGYIRHRIYNYLRGAKKTSDSGFLENFNPTKFKVDQIIDALRGVCHQNHFHANGTIWLDERKKPNPKHLISFQNGLLDMEDWRKDQTAQLMPHTPLLLNMNSLNFDYDPYASEPREWIKFLDSIWANDAESKSSLQEWMGYLLVQDTRYHKILLMIGPPRSGKGTIGRVLHELLGAFNTVGPTLSSLGSEFGLQPLLNKMLAIISDARLNSRGNTSSIIERLLSISGEDPLTINRKFLSALTVQLPTRIMMMSNELPDMRDSSGALAKRYIVLTLKNSWLGKEDTYLLDRLREELPGILLWALKGLARLQERGKFVQPTSSTEMIEELEAMTSPIKAFINEMCEFSQSGVTSIEALFKAWQLWCDLTGHPHPGNVQSFGKHFRAAIPEIEIYRPQDSSHRGRCYKGISLRFKDPSADVRGQKWAGFH